MPTETLPKPIEIIDDDTKQRRAPLWKVLFHNDNKTSMEFVIHVLMKFFGHDIDKAMELMLEVHEKGIGLAGVYQREIAELKQEQVTSDARTSKYPLTVTIEADE